MEILARVFEFIRPIFPMSAVMVGALLVLFAIRMVAERRYSSAPSYRFRIQVIMIVLTLLSFLAVVIVLPVSDTTRGQLLSLIGVVLSAAIALSSTTFVGNAMAGFMLRAVRSFRAGDFIRIGDHFGRVSEQGLFHIEIQTEDRDLTTLPNLLLVTQPYKVIRSSGTMITGEVSLGYDVSATRITKALLRAAESAGLTEPFVHIVSLGDFSVLYRVAGLLTEVRQVLSSRSRLREEMLNALHQDGIEIVSPTFMNTRAHPPDSRFMPPLAERSEVVKTTAQASPEDVVFDKALVAEALDQLRLKRDELKVSIKSKEAERDEAPESERARLDAEIQRLERQLESMEAEIKTQEAKID